MVAEVGDHFKAWITQKTGDIHESTSNEWYVPDVGVGSTTKIESKTVTWIVRRLFFHEKNKLAFVWAFWCDKAETKRSYGVGNDISTGDYLVGTNSTNTYNAVGEHMWVFPPEILADSLNDADLTKDNFYQSLIPGDKLEEGPSFGKAQFASDSNGKMQTKSVT